MAKKILVADDSATARNMVASLLREQGYQVIEAEDGLEAIRHAYQSYPDLIVLDIFMPKINGYQVCRMLKNDELTKNIPVVVLTSAASKENRFWSLRTGADRFVTKSDSLDNFASTVSEMLSKAPPQRFTKEHVAKVVPSDPAEIFEKLAGLLDKELYTATLDKMKYEIILQGIGDGLFSINREGVITEFNAATESISGISRTKALGQNARELFKDTLCKESCLFDEAFSNKTDIIDRERSLAVPGCAGEKRPVMISVSLIKEDEDKIEGAICVIRDISKLKAVEKMKEDFVSMLTHELRSPIAIVIEAIDVIGITGQLSEAQKKYCQMAKDRASRLLGLVNGLLDISKMESDVPVLNIASANIAELASKCISDMNVIANEKGITVLCEGMDQPVMSLVDSTRIEQVFINLLSNAFKFTPEQETVTVRIKDGPEFVECAVIDTGVGMHPDAAKKIFDKYHQIHDTTARQHGGTGLGLAVVKSIITAHKGKVWAESEPGKGARLIFTLPKTQGSNACAL